MSNTPEDKPIDAAAAADDASANPTFILCSAEPDITIVVGESVYKEYGQSIRCWSNYFDRALSSGMKEETSLQFEFPDREPKEWEWIVSLMAPMAQEKVTMDKLHVALDWFDFLCSAVGLATCDKVLCQELKTLTYPIAPNPNHKKVSSEQLLTAMKYLEAVVKYNLKDSKALCFKTVRLALLNDPIIFTKDVLSIVTRLVKEHVECRSQFFGPLKSYIPNSISDEQANVLIENDMLHEMIALHIHGIKQEKAYQLKQKQQCKRVVELVEKHSGPTDDLRKDFRNDDVWGSLVTNFWGQPFTFGPVPVPQAPQPPLPPRAPQTFTFGPAPVPQAPQPPLPPRAPQPFGQAYRSGAFVFGQRAQQGAGN